MAFNKKNDKYNVFLSADPSNAQRNRPIAQRDHLITQIGRLRVTFTPDPLSYALHRTAAYCSTWPPSGWLVGSMSKFGLVLRFSATISVRNGMSILATSQLITWSSRHTVMSSLGQLVTSQLITSAFFSQSQLVTRSSRHTVISSQASIVQSYGYDRDSKFSGHADIGSLPTYKIWVQQDP